MLDSKEPQGLLGSALSPNMPLLMAGLGMMGSGYKGALPGLMAGMEAQRKQQGVQDWSALLGGGALGGSGASQTAGTAPAVPSPMLGIGGPSAASPAGGMRAQSGAAPGNYGEVVKRIVGVESGGRANARNPRSSATGLGQFIDSTWLATLKKHRPDLAQGQSDQQLLALRTDPGLSREMTAAYAQDNADALAAQGLPTGPAEIYAAHHLGPAGAAKVLSAAPNTPLSSLLDAGAMQANPHLQGMTAGGFRQWAAGKMRQETAGPVPSPQAQQSFVSGLTPEARQRLARLAANNPGVASAILTAMFKGQESYTLGPGQVRYRGNQVVARGPAKPREQTDDIREFQFARQNGYTGSFPEFLRLKGGASGPNPTDDMKEYSLARSQGYDGSFRDWVLDKMRNTVTPGGRVISGTGETVAAEPAKPPTPTDELKEYQAAKEQGFTGSFIDYKQAIRPERVPRMSVTRQGNDLVVTDTSTGQEVNRIPGAGISERSFDRETKLRGEFTKAINTFMTVQDAFGRVTAAVQERATNPEAVSPASDIALVFGYMKMLDPTSVVREGEYATAQNAAGVPERIRNLYNKAVEGEFLTDEQRQDMVDTASRLYTQSRETAEEQAKRFRALAQGYQVDPERVVALPELLSVPQVGERGAPNQPPPPGPPGPGPTDQTQLTPEAIQRLPLARTPQEAVGFPSGTLFRDPQGNVRRVP